MQHKQRAEQLKQEKAALTVNYEVSIVALFIIIIVVSSLSTCLPLTRTERDRGNNQQGCDEEEKKIELRKTTPA